MPSMRELHLGNASTMSFAAQSSLQMPAIMSRSLLPLDRRRLGYADFGDERIKVAVLAQRERQCQNSN